MGRGGSSVGSAPVGEDLSGERGVGWCVMNLSWCELGDVTNVVSVWGVAHLRRISEYDEVTCNVKDMINVWGWGIGWLLCGGSTWWTYIYTWWRKSDDEDARLQNSIKRERISRNIGDNPRQGHLDKYHLYRRWPMLVTWLLLAMTYLLTGLPITW